MISKRLVLRVSVGIFALALVSFLTVAIAPFMVNGPGLSQQLVNKISEFTGGDVVIKGRIGLASFFSLSIEAEDVEMVGIKKLGPVDSITASRIAARIDWLDLLSGGNPFERLTIETPQVGLAANGQKVFADTPQSALTQMFAALESSPFEDLVIRDGSFNQTEIVVPAPGIKPASNVKLPVDILNARLSRSKNGRRLTARGRVRWNDQVLMFKGRRGRPATLDGMTRTPIDLTVNGAPMNLNFSGDLILKEPLEAVGNFEFSTHDASQLPAWLRLSWSIPNGINRVSASGFLTFSSGNYTLDSAIFSINGYSANGSLTATMNGQCPAIQGSLAFQTLDLDFLLHAAAGKDGGGENTSLVTCLDADMRISADTVSAGSIRAGSGAAGVGLKSGKITADIAELEIFDGISRGNIEIDLSKTEPVFAIRMTAEDVDIRHMTEAIRLVGWLEGKAGVNAELRAKGRKLDDILKSLNGNTKITLTEGGTLGETVRAMLASTEKWTPGGLSPAEVIRPSFKNLRAELAAKDGLVTAKMFDLSEDEMHMSIEGSIDVIRKTLACHLNIKTAAAEAAARGRNGQTDVQTLTMEGPWNSPKFVWNGRHLNFSESNITNSAPF